MPDRDQARQAVVEASNALADFLRAHAEIEPALTEAESEGLDRIRSASATGLGYAWKANLLRIAAADLTGETDLETTSRALSRLADAVLARGLELAEAEIPGHIRHGWVGFQVNIL